MKVPIPDACDGVSCSREGQFCIVERGQAKCICPRCKDELDDPLCGLIGNKMVTMENECALRRLACLGDETVDVLHKGKCAGGSVSPGEEMDPPSRNFD